MFSSRSLLGLIAFAVVALAAVNGCRSKEKLAPGEPADSAASVATSKNEPETADLTQAAARDRKARVDQVAYALKLTLPAGDEAYRGQLRISFNLKTTSRPLRLEFFEGQVSALRVNNKSLAPETVKKPYAIELPAQALVMGANVVDISFTQAYSHQGQGLHRFVDPETNEVFLYSQFEAYDANRFMPCFDQPDLRSTFDLEVDAPTSWTVISTAPETAVKEGLPGRRVWTFARTQPIATYLFSLHAGPYHVWKDSYGEMPLRLFARPSLARYVEPDVKEWFTVTKQGLKFFEAWYAFKYPFVKFDQLIVPEFNAGAMENPGAITYSEHRVSRGGATRAHRLHTYGTVLHEMAHLWFGDTVTMKWWNDLWLNESFASYMAALALGEATEFKEAWQDFFASEKQWAYWEDGLVTTHPIEARVDSVKEAFGNFDGITYGKGASVLQQLRAYISPEAFQKGIQKYIAAHAMGNAELKDFIAALQGETKRDLNLFAERWLRQSGTDKLNAEWTCSDKKLKALRLVTTPSTGAQFRPQTVTVGLFKRAANGELSRPYLMPVDLTQPVTTLNGDWDCPDFIYPNVGDHGFVVVSLDPLSLQHARAHVSRINDTLLRTMVWADLWEMVRAGEMPLNEYIEILTAQLPKENDRVILELVVHTIFSHRNHPAVLTYWPLDANAKSARLKFLTKMEDEFLRRFKQAKAGSDEQKVWFDNYVALAETPRALDQLAKWSLTNAPLGPKFPLDLDRRWALVHRLARYNHPRAEASLTLAKSKDPSDRGQRAVLAAEAIRPDANVKRKWVNVLTQPKPQLSFITLRAVTEAIFPHEQGSLAQEFTESYFKYLKANGLSENETFVEAAAVGLSPLDCEAAGAQRFKEFLSDSGSRFVPSLAKALKVLLQEDQRCQAVRARSHF